jgi:hypothetical protein
VDLIPKIYDTARAVRILGEDGTEEVVMINQLFEHNGKPVQYSFDAGKYDVVVDTGPSFATKREEALQAMLDLTKAVPGLMANAGDLLVKNMDLPGASELAERIKKTLPPGIVDDPKKQPVPPEVQAQMQQMSQLVEQLTGQLNQASEEIKTKKMELESKERIEMKKLEVAVEMKMAELGSKEGLALLTQEIAQIQTRLAMIGQNEPIDEESNGDGSGRAEMPNEQNQMIPGPPIQGDPGVMQ